MEQTTYFCVIFFLNTTKNFHKVLVVFQITNQHFQIKPNFSKKMPFLQGVLIGYGRLKEALIQLLKFYQSSYWMWALKRCWALIRICTACNILKYSNLSCYYFRKQINSIHQVTHALMSCMCFHKYCPSHFSPSCTSYRKYID